MGEKNGAGGTCGGSTPPTECRRSRSLNVLVQRLLARGPSTWGEFLGLESLDHAKNLVNVAAHAEVVHRYPTNRA